MRSGFEARELNNGSGRVIDALVAQGDPAAVAGQLRAHLDAGASHVALQVHPLTDGSQDRLSSYPLNLVLY